MRETMLVKHVFSLIIILVGKRFVSGGFFGFPQPPFMPGGGNMPLDPQSFPFFPAFPNPSGNPFDLLQLNNSLSMFGDFAKTFTFAKFILDALGLMFTKGVFFTTPLEIAKTPFAFQPPGMPDAPMSRSRNPMPNPTSSMPNPLSLNLGLPFLNSMPNPTDSMPNPMGSMPNPTDSMPNPMDSMPNPMGSMPNPTDSMPNPMGSMPNPTDVIPNPMGSNPNSKGSMPNPMDAFPNRMESMPNRMESMPNPLDSMSNPTGSMPNPMGSMPNPMGSMSNPMGSFPFPSPSGGTPGLGLGPLELSDNPQGDPLETLISIFEYVITVSPHRAHPFYLKRDASGLDPYAVIGEILSVVITTAILIEAKGYHVEIELALYIFWSIIEMTLVHSIRMLIGYPDGDGVMTLGEGMTNMDAVKVAISEKFPIFSLKGFQPFPMLRVLNLVNDSPPEGWPTVLISEGNSDGLRIVFGLFTGIPTKYHVKVKMDRDGRMDPNDLEKKIVDSRKSGLNPFIVIAQVGSKNLGAVDPIEKIVRITEKYNLWLHIDGNFGGPCMFWPDIKKRWKGVERSNSFGFSFSSLLGSPVPSSFLIINKEGILKNIWDFQKTFLKIAAHVQLEAFRSPKLTDPGKVWVMWFIKGHRGFNQHIRYAYNLTEYAREQIRPRENFELVTSVADTPVIPFRVIPRNLKARKSDIPAYRDEMDQFSNDLKFRLLTRGLTYMTLFRRTPKEPKHFMFPLTNSFLTTHDIDYVLDLIDCQARNIEENANDICFDVMSRRVQNQAKSVMTNPVDGFAPYANAFMPDVHMSFLRGLMDVFLQGVIPGFGNSNKPPELDVRLKDDGTKQRDISPMIQMFLGFFTMFPTNSTTPDSHDGPPVPPFFNIQNMLKMMPQNQIVGMITDIFLAFMAPSMESREASPPFMEVKDNVEKHLRGKVGYPNSDGDGVTVGPDGTLANNYVINLAKYHKASKNSRSQNPDTKRLEMYISNEAHYSWQIAAAAVGIGIDHCIYVPVDQYGRMDPNSLQKAIDTTKSNGNEPFLVVSTLGTDVIGAIDHIDKIADVAARNQLWLHVDGKFGGPLILSKKHKPKTNGIERSDSFTFSPTRFYPGDEMKFATLVVRHKGVFKEMFDREKENYPDHSHDDDDDDTSVGPRSPDEFKFFLMIKSDGAEKTEERINTVMERTQKGLRKMKESKSFELILPEVELTTICFNYIPVDYRDEQGLDVLEGIQIMVEEKLKEQRVPHVDFTNSTLYEMGNYGFLRISVSGIAEPHLDCLVEKIEKFAKEINTRDALKARQERYSSEEEDKFSTGTTTTTTITTKTLIKRRTYKKGTSVPVETQDDYGNM